MNGADRDDINFSTVDIETREGMALEAGLWEGSRKAGLTCKIDLKTKANNRDYIDAFTNEVSTKSLPTKTAKPS